MAKRARGPLGARWRLASSVALLALGLAPVTVGLAQESPPETGEIRNGTAKATALVSRVGPGVGDLELAMRGGIAVTQVTNALAQATSHTADLGLIGTSLTAETCRGNQYVQPEDLPQPTSVDNRDGDAQDTRDETGTQGVPFGAGRMHVEAYKDPAAATAVTRSSGFDIGPAVRVGSGTSEAATRVLPGKGREANAVSTSSLTLGTVTMEGMRWRAYHRTGIEPLAESSFDIGRAAIGGLPFPTDDLAAFERAAKDALAPLGVTITFPRPARALEPTDLVRMTPMRIELRDSPAGKTLLGPALDASREARGNVFDTLVGEVCDLASFLLVGDVIVTILSGTGFLTLEIGGAEAASSDFQLANPFGAAVAPPGGPVPPGAAPAVAGSDPATPVVSTPNADPTPAMEPAASPTGALEELCESVHPNRDVCSNGAALALGALSLVAAIGLAGAEVLRYRRMSPEATP